MELPLKSINSYQATADVFVTKFGTAIQTMQNELILMDIKQSPNESLSSYHKRYNDLLFSIPVVDDKVAYMSFSNGLAYGKLKKALLLKNPLLKDALTKEVKQHIELEELRKKATETIDLSEIVLKKEGPSELRGIELPHDDPADIALLIANFTVERMLVDT
ncbi:hypothetical protein LIER_24326 [Lithospermum erythrorhizon]|uniref:Retrotransposon gag domain-containing protein n=1 Tax=Lithospermum erythrorhizon TaxID=34254 RepID=A0AAV3R260_LITER